MSPVALSSLITLAAFLTSVNSQVTGTYPQTPLVSKTFAYPSGIPYQADTDTGLIRGSQFGYNLCNSTTEGQTSLCQTSFLNSVDDFCLWAPADPGSTVGDHEGEMIAWCTKPGRGTRLIPKDTLQGVQFMRTPDYVQVVGYIDQTKVDLTADDYGGELDPHGADLRGNPLGGLFYSNAWSSSPNDYKQVFEWHNFIGTGFFCLKACDPAGPNAAHFCEHVFDRIGCAYNAPNNAQKGVFEACLGDNQDFPGVYTQDGVVHTFSQPPESLGPISSMPYQPRVPASSSCSPYQSADIYKQLDNVAGASDASTSASLTASASGAKPTGAAASGKSGTSSSTKTSSGDPAKQTTSDAVTLSISAVSLLSIGFSVAFLS